MYNYITNVYIFVSCVSLVEQMFPNLPVHMSSLVMLSGIRAAQFLFFCILFCRSLYLLFIFIWSFYVLLIVD